MHFYYRFTLYNYSKKAKAYSKPWLFLFNRKLQMVNNLPTVSGVGRPSGRRV